jgi:3-dehydroquinate synthase
MVDVIRVSNYKVYVGIHIMKQLNEYFKDYINKNIFIIIDEKVNFIYHTEICEWFSNYKFNFVVIKEGEKSKSITTYETVISELLNNDINKDDLICAIGGGVTTDLAGYVSSTLMRGIDLVLIPTTLLSMIDASIGSKNGIDFLNNKNIIGTFYNPKFVLVDPNFLTTLTMDDYNNGLVEAIKIAFISNQNLYNQLKLKNKITKKQIVSCIRLKKFIIAFDFFDRGYRMKLNFGHTFGHVIEKTHNFEIKHGTAVAYGMLMSLALSVKLGLTNQSIYDELKETLVNRGLVVTPIFDIYEYYPLIFKDKKNTSDGLNFIIVTSIGHSEIIKITPKDFLL